MGLLSRIFDPDGSTANHRGSTAASGLIDAVSQGGAETDSVPALTRQSQQLVLEINRSAAEVPGIGVVLARAVTDTINGVLQAPDAANLDLSVRVAMHGVLTDYLPGSIRAYVGAVRSGGAREAATDALVDQLITLRDSVERLAEASRSRDLQALQVHGRFLEDKFGGSELDL
ncbi:hypothetical protein [Leekyejoonella antrihumi]|uniref:Uncharacterized protein n=1 Tax=Leekyejoonella antrihumi TaxID=1660198 RepID=A0A563E6P0_9MICO|nr:hypothetical protein [Leekyejoonella antrihumi]TWP38186.1 hypothetical protein FGL98_02860 [Leekyejoonella antrihumi]